MITYKQIEPNREVTQLYKYHYPEQYRQMLKYRCNFYVVALDGDKIISAIGIKIKPDGAYRYLHGVTHKDYRGKGIFANILHIAVYYCIKNGAEIIDFNHNRSRNIDYFEEASGIRYANRPDLDSKKYTYYRCKVKDIKLNKLKKVWEKINYVK